MMSVLQGTALIFQKLWRSSSSYFFSQSLNLFGMHWMNPLVFSRGFAASPVIQSKASSQKYMWNTFCNNDNNNITILHMHLRGVEYRGRVA